MTDLDPSIAWIADAYASAVYAKDVDALMRLYDPEARVFDMWGVWSYEGAQAWRRNVEAWLASLGSERVQVTFDDLRATTAARDVAALSAIVTYAAIAADGQPLRSMQNRLSWVLRMDGDAPRIVHEHTSAPIGFEDMKAILQR